MQIAYLNFPRIEDTPDEEPTFDTVARAMVHDPNPFVYGKESADSENQVFQNCDYALIGFQQVSPFSQTHTHPTADNRL